MSTHQFDVVIIGSGAAGLTAAINLAQDKRVAVIAKGPLDSGSTAWAQGGIAAVLDSGDSFEAHVNDTMIAGAGLNRRQTVEFVVEHAPAAIERLSALGVPFNAGEAFGERWHLTREGGHSHRRIVHVDDATGAAVQRALVKAAIDNPNITLMTDRVAIDLITSRHGVRYSGEGDQGRAAVTGLWQHCVGPDVWHGTKLHGAHALHVLLQMACSLPYKSAVQDCVVFKLWCPCCFAHRRERQPEPCTIRQRSLRAQSTMA